MSIALDGYDVLMRLGGKPDAFAAIRADVDIAARTLVIKCLKARSTDLDAARAIFAALGDQFALLIEDLKDSELKNLVVKFDRSHPEIASMAAQDHRQHLLDLVRGATDPAPSLPKTPKAAGHISTTSAYDAMPQRLQSDVMDLFRSRGKERGDD